MYNCTQCIFILYYTAPEVKCKIKTVDFVGKINYGGHSKKFSM